MKEKQKNKRNRGLIGDHSPVGFFQTISFQNLFVNIVVLIMFVAVSFYTLSSMNQIKEDAVSALSNSDEALITLGDMKANVSSAVAEMSDVTGICRSAEINDSTKKREAAASRMEIETLYNKLPKQETLLKESPLWALFTPGTAAVDDAAAKLETYFTDVFTILDYYQAGNYGAGIALMEGQYQADMVSANTAIAVMQDDVIIVANRVGPSVEKEMQSSVKVAVVMMVIVAVLILMAIVIMQASVIKAIKNITKAIGGIVSDIDEGNGDLSKRIEYKSNNELKLIIGGFNSFMDTLQHIIGKVKEGTVVLEESSTNVSQRITSVSGSIMNTSAAMEELSATMDSVSAVTSNLNERLKDVDTATEEIRTQAREGMDTAKQIQESAITIKDDTNTRKDGAKAKVEALSTTLAASVKDAEKVGQINDLTANIMDIASRTNLLSLNASIEAARAGEAGRGFAVVAEEIGELATNSHQTAGSIQAISNEVTSAVTALSENATQVIEFINGTILSDYDSFGNLGDGYMETAQSITAMVESFTNKADELSETMEKMIGDINSIAEAVNESSEAISMSAENSQEIVNEVTEISSAVEKNTEVSDDLTSSVAMFKQ
ncbi:MAG: methyl-accepting chemotaxis protein [Pseudobutyrivibrio sp.]|nr:methyl-accepting chemotaxis protein [Pseudobutyrivibrio sp.]